MAGIPIFEISARTVSELLANVDHVVCSTEVRGKRHEFPFPKRDGRYVLPFPEFSVSVTGGQITSPLSEGCLFAASVDVVMIEDRCAVIANTWSTVAPEPIVTAVRHQCQHGWIDAAPADLTVLDEDWEEPTPEDFVADYVVFALLHLLAHRDVEIVDETPQMSRQQRRHAERAGNPVPPRYVVRIAHGTSIRRILDDLERNRNRRYPRPHDRRAHVRRHPKTKMPTVRVRAAKVRGGRPVDGVATTYRVVGTREEGVA